VKHYCDPSKLLPIHAQTRCCRQSKFADVIAALRERERERDWRQSGRICNATGYLLQWKKIQKQLVIFVAFLGWLLGQLRFYKFFKKYILLR
jgi:hypothetical protein